MQPTPEQQKKQLEEKIDAAKSYIESNIFKLDKYKKVKIQDEEKKLLWDQIYRKMTDLNINQYE